MSEINEELLKVSAQRSSHMNDQACTFYCDQILNGTIDVPVCFENERVFAFYHTNPIWEQHVVLLPRRHIESLVTMDEGDNELLLELMTVARRIATDFMGRFGACRVYTNMGDYQSSKHLHWHIGCGKQLRPY